MSDNPMFVYAGEYDSVDDAKVDLEALKDFHRQHFVGTYDAAVLAKKVVVIALCVMVIYGLTKYSGQLGRA